jgi:hypothetical protein
VTLRSAPASQKPAVLRAALTSPLAWVLAGACLLNLAGIGWGLPASDGWDNDGVAPRDFLAGLVETFSPGRYFRYPPVHLALLALLNSPVAAIALARARSLAPGDVIAEFVRPPYMTVFALSARAVSVAMAAGLIWALAKMAEEVRGKRAGVWTAALATTCVPLVYYAHTSNLDVPYLFWGCLAVLAIVQAVARSDPQRLRRAAVLAALSVGTKDQAYALFVGAVPLALVLWVALDPDARRRARPLTARTLGAAVTCAAVLALVDGPLYNPVGFGRRLAYLAGPASQPFAPYTDDWPGRFAVLSDAAARWRSCYPAAFALPILVGTGLALRRGTHGPARRVAGLVPLLVALSFTAAFNCIARRTDHRFVLPQAVMCSVYGGIGLDALVDGARHAFARWSVRLGVAVAFGEALLGALDVNANLLLDPRYDAESWLRTHASPAEVVETYGLNVYLPRFPPGVPVRRIGPGPVQGRSPLPGVEEVVARYGDAGARAASFLVVPEAWARRHLADPGGQPVAGRVMPSTEAESARDADAGEYFRALLRGEVVGYRLAHTSRWASALWPPLDIHASTSREVWIYERTK